MMPLRPPEWRAGRRGTRSVPASKRDDAPAPLNDVCVLGWESPAYLAIGMCSRGIY